MADMGHNSGEVNSGHLRAFIERIERLEEEKKALAEDIKDVYGEAKSTGFNVKIMRKIVALRRQDADKRAEEEAILDLYLNALGMLADTPLGQAAITKAFDKSVPLSDAEREKGMAAAFVDKDGHRVSIGLAESRS